MNIENEIKIKIEVGEIYRDAAGRKVQIMDKEKGEKRQFNGYIFPTDYQNANYWAYCEDGSTSDEGCALLEEWLAPKISEAWISINPHDFEEMHCSLEDAKDVTNCFDFRYLKVNCDTKTASVEVVS